MPIQVIVEKCTGCMLCIKACPFDAIRIMDRPEGRGLASDRPE
ncbi:MAG: 4Fe-4S dicluster domain-containing protein, partial [Candidatus Omnitrophica bacterium]|nr:4Fe-4S dicluster domain-containing protein [Candidatus Omnitrophota bacterium]